MKRTALASRSRQSGGLSPIPTDQRQRPRGSAQAVVVFGARISQRPLYVAFRGVRMISRFGGKAVRP
jgi:hypothetical protein